VQTSAGRISVSPIQNALFHAFGALYIRAGAYKLASDLLYTLQPHLLRQLVIFITDYQSGVIASKTNGFVIAGAMLVLQAIQAVCFNQYESAEALVRSNVRSALIMAIYEKTLKLSSKGREDNAGGVILNLIGGDVGKIENVVEQGHKIWSIPLQVGLILYGLYKCLGLTPILLGLGGMVLMGPLNKRVMK
jgi:hypothetical protein